jgi:hypothetical protein
VTGGVEIDADRIAVAVQASRLIAGLDSGRYGEIATYLPGRRVDGVRIRPESVTIGVVGRYPATAIDIDACVRAAVGPLDQPLHVRINDLHIGELGNPAGGASAPTSSLNHAARLSFPRPIDHTVNRS